MPKVRKEQGSQDRLSLAEEFANVAIGDRRLTNRLVKTACSLGREPSRSIPDACRSWAETKAIYRFLDNDKVTREVILESHRIQTLERIRQHRVILCVQDTTSLDYNTHPKTEGLGPYAIYPNTYGLLLHTVLAVSTAGVPLGILSQESWSRDAATLGKRHQRKDLSIAEKESSKWLEGMDNALAGLPDGIIAVTVCDREADIYDLFLKACQEKRHLLIRAVQDRRVGPAKEKLFTQVEKAPYLGECLVKVPRASETNEPPREARLAIRVCPVSIQAPLRRANESLPAVRLQAILAREVSAPEGVKPIEWLLLTTLQVENLQEAVEKIGWYRHRWKIERYHYVLKSGCKVEELQLETRERLQNAIAIYAVVAWKLTWLTYQARETPEDPCSLVLEPHEWQILYCAVTKAEKPPKKPPTLKETVILLARLGGFLARKHDGDPGVKVLWRGLQRLNDAIDVLKTLQSLHFPQDVGNE